MCEKRLVGTLVLFPSGIQQNKCLQITRPPHTYFAGKNATFCRQRYVRQMHAGALSICLTASLGLLSLPQLACQGMEIECKNIFPLTFNLII